MLVHDLSQGQAEVEWSATFEADGLPADEAREMLESALAANCLAKQWANLTRDLKPKRGETPGKNPKTYAL